MTASTQLIIASASSRRVSLLSQITSSFTAIAADIDETPHDNEPPKAYVKRMAYEKAKAVITPSGGQFVLGSDTSVIINGSILGKPKDFEDFSRMFGLLSNAWHQVMTSVSVLYYDKASKSDQENKLNERSIVVTTDVEFGPITQQQLLSYWHTKEPCDKAGGYAIQGIGGQFVKQIRGSYSAVVGLPLFETGRLLTQVGCKL